VFTLVAIIDRLIEQPHTSVCEDRINFFAQRCISSFLPQRKRLLCLFVQIPDPRQVALFRYMLNTRQVDVLERLLRSAEHTEYADTVDHASRTIHAESDWQHTSTTYALSFVTALLDHSLDGDIFESVVLGFLAVIGVDRKNVTFYEAVAYTSKLSGFIKIS